jgi:hypothetical protein
MKAVVINNCYGGYGTSDIVTREYLTRKGIPFTEEEGGKYMGNIFHITDDQGMPKRFSGTWDIERDDALLVELVAQLGEGANGSHAELQINYYDEGMQYHISEYDGWESLTLYVPVTTEELREGLSYEKVRLIEKCGKVELVR